MYITSYTISLLALRSFQLVPGTLFSLSCCSFWLLDVPDNVASASQKADTKLKVNKQFTVPLVLQSSGLIEHFKSLGQGMAAYSLCSAGTLISFWIFFSSQGQV